MTRAVLAIMIALAVRASIASAEEENSRVSVAFDVGFATRYESDSDIWGTGTVAGVTVLWRLGDAFSVGGRIGLDHWTYNDVGVVTGLVPEGTEVLSEQSRGQLQMIEFGPTVRVDRDGIFGSRLGLCLQVCGNVVHVEKFAVSEVLYSTGGARTGVREFEINESNYRMGFTVSGGFTRPVSGSSWLELTPFYRGVFQGGDVANIAGVSLAFRAAV